MEPELELGLGLSSPRARGSPLDDRTRGASLRGSLGDAALQDADGAGGDQAPMVNV